MTIKSINDIIFLSDSNVNPDKMAYKHLIKQIDTQILDQCQSQGSLTFQTPSIIWGKPMFESKKVEKKIVKHAASDSFKTVPGQPLARAVQMPGTIPLIYKNMNAGQV